MTWLDEIEKKITKYNKQFDGLLDGNIYEMRDERRMARVIREQSLIIDSVIDLTEQIDKALTPFLNTYGEFIDLVAFQELKEKLDNMSDDSKELLDTLQSAEE